MTQPMNYTLHTGQPYDLLVENDDHPFGWTVGFSGGTYFPAFVWRFDSVMVPAVLSQPEWDRFGQPSGRWINGETGAVAFRVSDDDDSDGVYVRFGLFDADTNETIFSTATPQQWWASEFSDTGHILIDAGGWLVTAGTSDAGQPGVRKVSVRKICDA